MATHGAEDTRHILDIFLAIGGRHNSGGSNETTRTARTARIRRIRRSSATMGTDCPQIVHLLFFRGNFIYFFTFSAIGGRHNNRGPNQTTKNNKNTQKSKESGTAMATNSLELYFKRGTSCSFVSFLSFKIVDGRTLITSKKGHCEKRVEAETLTHLVGDGATR